MFHAKRSRVGRRKLLVAAGCILPFPAIRALAQTTGVALVIGNSKYRWEATLPNVRRDAPDMARAFQAIGLKTELVQDAGRDAMRRAFDNFAAASNGASFAAFYFAGHGASWGRDTYLVPVDSDLSDPSVVPNLIPTTSLDASMKGAACRLQAFDNCRNNPADGWRQLEAERTAASGAQSGRPLAPNTLVLYSTAPGRIARDGPPGENSPFAAELLQHLQGGAVDLQELPAKLRRDLLIGTQGRQVLWDRSSYSRPFLLGAPSNRPAVPANRSGWNPDPSRIVELPSAYAFARENGIPLPLGLIAHRPTKDSRDSQKIGSFKYISTSPLGHDPALLVVLSVEEQQTAEVILSGKGVWNQRMGRIEGGTFWRFVTGALSGNKLEFVPRAQGARTTFSWSDANSGNFSRVFEDAGSTVLPYSTRFTRLDG